MSKYLIHTCEKRKWYVDEYLVPSMLKQGIDSENILVYNDETKQGNLKSFIESSKLLGINGGTWHLQDDVIISSQFKLVTEMFDKGIVCGFCNCYSEDLPIGIRLTRDMWYSFPCIRIPNNVLKSFINWLQRADTQNRYRTYIEANKFDDTLFRAFMLEVYPNELVHNLCPNIVDNIDYLIGGTIINVSPMREGKNINSIYFEDKQLIEELKISLKDRVYKNK